MAPGVFILNGDEPKRRIYSKKGCRECKRRKIKCDEGKPSCWQCSRLKKLCNYPKKGERVQRISMKHAEQMWRAESQQVMDAESTNYNTLAQSQLPEGSIQRYSSDSQTGSTPAQVAAHSTENTSVHLVHLVHPADQKSYHSETSSHANDQNSHHPHPHPSSASSHHPSSVPSASASASSHRSPQESPHRSPTARTGEFGDHDGRNDQMQSYFLAEMSPNRRRQLVRGTKPEAGPRNMFPHPHNKQSKVSSSYQEKNSGLMDTPKVSLEHLLNASPDQSFPMSPFSFEIDPNDLTLLATDLNNIVANIVGEKSELDAQNSAPSDTFHMYEKAPEGQNPEDGKAATHLREKPATLESQVLSAPSAIAPSAPTRPKMGTRGTPIEEIGRGLPLSFIKLSKPHEKLYLEEFYHEYSGIMLPFAYWNALTKLFINPVRDILLTVAARETYLLAAILAQGAYTALRRSGLPEDERAHHHYLLSCLQLLGPALSQSKNSKLQGPSGYNVLLVDIEAMLLTVLLLTSAHALNTKQDWRAHLRGARDLLLKLNTLQRSAALPILVFCKYWYSLIEILAGLLLDFGGTLKREEEMDTLVSSGFPRELSIMKNFKLVSENGYNLIYGYPNKCVELLRDLAKFLNKLREGVVPDADEVLGLLADFNAWRNETQILKTGLLEGDLYDSKYNVTGSLVDSFTEPGTNNGEKFQICWPDMSHLAYTIAAQITLLTRGLGLSAASVPVQQLVTKFTSMLRFLQLPEQPKVSCAVLMIQWPSLVVGINCVKEEDRFLVMKLFRVLAQIGSGSARYLLRKLHKAWQGGSGDDLDSVDILTY